MSAEPQAPSYRQRATRVALSARAEHEVGEGLSLCLHWLQMPLRESLRDFDQRLFSRAESIRDHLDQQACFDSRAAIQREASGFQERFAAHVMQCFRSLGDTPEEHTAPTEHLALSLVDPVEQEQGDALASIAARGEARNASTLFELGYRMAVLAGTPPLEGDALPVGPRALAAALRVAAAPIELSAAHRILLFQAVDSRLITAADSLYGALNEHYKTRGILAGFRIFPHARVASTSRTRVTEATPPGDNAHTPLADAVTSQNIGVLESLRDLLAQRAQHGHAPVATQARLATDDELQTALSALQGHLTDVADKASREIRSAQRLRDELLAQLDSVRPAGSAPAELTPEHGDTVELTAMLFENLARELQTHGAGRSVLGGLQWPILRAAVNDRGFFDQREHPARQLLDTVAEAAHDWLDPADGEADRGLVDRLERLVLDAGQGQVIDPAWRADIEQQVAQLKRKAHVAERRQIETMEGRDRLDRARRRAGELMRERLGFGPAAPRGVLRILLERTWSDVLALHILRGGETGEAFVACLDVTDQLLGRHPVVDAERLRADVEAGLEHLGMHRDEASQVARGLLETPDAPTGNAERLTPTDVAMRLKQRPRLGESSAPGHEPAPEVRPTPLDPRSKRIYDGFADLRFGTWFEFHYADGTSTHRKLAWFSPATGRCLFVNARGVRCDDIDLTRLARLVASGEAKEWTDRRASFIDRAWAAVARNLRRAGLHTDSMADSA
ncbi:uncharacterized protein DUF1631 [Luteibacter rhizovicinus]|uniref:Uncharacterized protein DUF1631 n=1 Tax=Luteibacter rhizovicinus TaxID=242606 RepID=A0A4R3YIU2_9GAMM|nr:DUF1631 family protein [Luteibacter rhizovicinus]TCV92110.1 uncharacterized protein DUF1631 [Luteibacter rhizovicinus]